MAEVGGVDAIVFGCGSSGTMTGLSRCFAEKSPQTELVLADPVGSILEEYINRGTISEKSASWMVEGIGEDFLPPISDFTRVKKAYAISDKESFLTARELLEKEGILGGSSTGTLLAAALKYCREQTTPKKVLVFVCDTGNKYLSKMYNDYWMLDNGFLARKSSGDLRDLILRPYSQRDTVVVGPNDLLVTAYQRMKLYDVSQLPVMDGDNIVGIVDESDVLLHVYGDEARFRDPVSTAMVSKLDKIDVQLADRDAAAGVRPRPCRDRGRRRQVPRPDHPHRPAQLPAPARAVMNAATASRALAAGRPPARRAPARARRWQPDPACRVRRRAAVVGDADRRSGRARRCRCRRRVWWRCAWAHRCRSGRRRRGRPSSADPRWCAALGRRPAVAGGREPAAAGVARLAG